MFLAVLSFVVLMVSVSVYSNVVMRVRLTRFEPSGNKLAWWRPGHDDVMNVYEDLFPRSVLPFFSQFAFWFVVEILVIVVGCLVLKLH